MDGRVNVKPNAGFGEEETMRSFLRDTLGVSDDENRVFMEVFYGSGAGGDHVSHGCGGGVLNLNQQESSTGSHERPASSFSNGWCLPTSGVAPTVPTDEFFAADACSVASPVSGFESVPFDPLKAILNLPLPGPPLFSSQRSPCRVAEPLGPNGILSGCRPFGSSGGIGNTGHSGRESQGALASGSSSKTEVAAAAVTEIQEIPMGTVNSNISQKKALVKDLATHLRSHAHCLLKDAGWKIEPRKRCDRVKLTSSYVDPEDGRSLTAFCQAWKTCGKKLFDEAESSRRNKIARQWAGLDAFWSDLANVISFIEKELQRPEGSISLLHRWKALDPFMAVVWLDKKIGVLRGGKALRAVDSATFVLEGDSPVQDSLADPKKMAASEHNSSFFDDKKGMNFSGFEMMNSTEASDHFNQEFFAIESCGNKSKSLQSKGRKGARPFANASTGFVSTSHVANMTTGGGVSERYLDFSGQETMNSVGSYSDFAEADALQALLDNQMMLEGYSQSSSLFANMESFKKQRQTSSADFIEGFHKQSDPQLPEDFDPEGRSFDDNISFAAGNAELERTSSCKRANGAVVKPCKKLRKLSEIESVEATGKGKI